MIIFLGDDTYYKDIVKKSKNDPDIVVSCQYRYKVPKSLLNNYTCVNIHYGKLPYFSGCNPIYWQLLKGDSAGVTLHYMDENFDTGDIIGMWECPTGNLTADELYALLAKKGRELLDTFYKGILDGTAPRKPQDLSNRTYYKAEDVDFEKEKKLDIYDMFDKRKVQSIHFKGKQLPILKIGDREYEVSCRNASL